MVSEAAAGSRTDAWAEALFFAGVIALAPAPLFAASMGYFGLLLVTVFFLFYVARGGWRSLRPTALDLPLAVFLIIRILSTLTSVAPLVSWKGLEKSGLLLAYYPLAHMRLAAARRRAGIWLHVAAVLVAAVVGVVEFAARTETRVVSRTGGYTTFAEMLVVATCLLAGAMAFARGRGWLARAAATLPALAALVFTFCRGQWLALAGGVGLIGWVKDRRVWALLLVVAVVAGAAVYFSPAGAASGRFTLGDPAFENYRDVLWRGGLKVLFARPLTGFGPNTIKIVFPDQTRFYSPVAKVIGWHNDFLQLAVESGLPGAAAGVWLAVAAFAVAWRRFRRGGDDAGLGLGLAAALVTLAAAALVGNVVTDPAMIMEFVLLWGLFAPLAANREDGRPNLP